MPITESNPNCFKQINLRLKQLGGLTGKVGWFESAKYENGTPVAYVAAIQELGSGPIPPRPFMRPAAIKNEQNWIKTAEFASNQVLDGKITGRQAMEMLTMRAEGDVSQAIVDVTSPALSPITLGLRKLKQQGRKITGATVGEVARRLRDGTLDTSGVSTKPLNDTGLMLATLTSAVENEQ